MPSHAPDPAARPEGYDHIGTTWEDAMRWCREQAARIADKFPDEVGPAIIEATINERFPHDRRKS